MNCQTYRQHCTLEPNCHEPDFLFHQQVCSSCAAFTENLLRFEQTLVEAIKVEIPEGLAQHKGFYAGIIIPSIRYFVWIQGFYFWLVAFIAASVFPSQDSK